MARNLFVLTLVGIIALGASATVLAQDSGCSGEKAAKSGCCSKDAKATVVANAQQKGCSSMESCSSKGQCSTKYLPAMAYRIGDKTVGCPKEAKTLAASHGGNIVYVVGDKNFNDQGKAMLALADASEKYVVTFAKVASKGGACTETKTCPKSGEKYTVKSDKPAMWTVAGRSFDCQEKAKKASGIAQKAIATVSMQYRVGKQDFCCSTMAGAESKKARTSWARIAPRAT